MEPGIQLKLFLFLLESSLFTFLLFCFYTARRFLRRKNFYFQPLVTDTNYADEKFTGSRWPSPFSHVSEPDESLSDATNEPRIIFTERPRISPKMPGDHYPRHFFFLFFHSCCFFHVTSRIATFLVQAFHGFNTILDFPLRFLPLNVQLKIFIYIFYNFISIVK